MDTKKKTEIHERDGQNSAKFLREYDDKYT